MASEFKEGQHIFFLMMDGKTRLDSQNKPRYYLTRERAQQYAWPGCEIVEYAPVYDTKPSCFMSGVVENSGVKWCFSESQDILTADVVEVTRCKDCKYASEFDGCEDYVEQVRCCTLHEDCDMLPKVWPYDFCSYGKRRGGD